MSRYRISAIKELRDQLLYAPQNRRRQQVERLENLIPEIQPNTEYPYDFIVYRITRFRTGTSKNEVYRGEHLSPDLARLLLDLSESIDIPVLEIPEPVYSVEDVCRMFNVSARTVARWRADGLLGRRFIFPDAQKRTGFRLSLLQSYIRARKEKVERSSRFSRISEHQKNAIIERARTYAGLGMRFSHIVKRIAAESRRSYEAIRYTLRMHDMAHPDDAIFPGYIGILTERDKYDIYRLYNIGVSVKALCRKYHRSRSGVYAIIAEMRIREILGRQIEYVDSAEFVRPGADAVILRDIKLECPPSGSLYPQELEGTVLPAHFSRLETTPPLSRREEMEFFRAYNYSKYKLAKLQQELATEGSKAGLLKDAKPLFETIRAIRERIVKANLRLVISVAKRHVGPLTNLLDLISEGNVCLLNAVEKFDYTKGNKFSTYLTWALIKHFARHVPEQNYRLSTFITGQEELLKAAGSVDSSSFEEAEAASVARDMLRSVLQKLKKRDRDIITLRYGIGEGKSPATLAEVGRVFGVSKERIRQIEERALAKLRELLVETYPSYSS